MTNEKKNALTELVRRLDGLYGEIYCCVGHAEAEDYLKALRIVAELADVQTESVYGNRTLYLISCADAVEKCIAIAGKEEK